VVVAAMRRCLAGTHVPAFLDPGARALLEQGRQAFRADSLDRRSILQVKRDCVVFPWVGSLKLETLALALLARNFQASPLWHTVEVRDCSADDLRAVLSEMAASSPPEGEALAAVAAKPAREKYDSYLTDPLLTKAVAAERLDAASIPAVARRILEPYA
jgi:ATP-dependent helicase Lhr and Lhr-like helicase